MGDTEDTVVDTMAAKRENPKLMPMLTQMPKLMPMLHPIIMGYYGRGYGYGGYGYGYPYGGYGYGYYRGKRSADAEAEPYYGYGGYYGRGYGYGGYRGYGGYGYG